MSSEGGNAWENRSKSSILLLEVVSCVFRLRRTDRWNTSFAARPGGIPMVAPAVEGIDLLAESLPCDAAHGEIDTNGKAVEHAAVFRSPACAAECPAGQPSHLESDGSECGYQD